MRFGWSTRKRSNIPGGPSGVRPRAKNVGWRLDLHVITPGLAGTVKSAEIVDGIANPNENFSDHAPLTLEYDLHVD